jgi:hypothetical protein
MNVFAFRPSIPVAHEMGAFLAGVPLRGLPNVPGEFGKSPFVVAFGSVRP